MPFFHDAVYSKCILAIHNKSRDCTVRGIWTLQISTPQLWTFNNISLLGKICLQSGQQTLMHTQTHTQTHTAPAERCWTYSPYDLIFTMCYLWRFTLKTRHWILFGTQNKMLMWSRLLVWMSPWRRFDFFHYPEEGCLLLLNVTDKSKCPRVEELALVFNKKRMNQNHNVSIFTRMTPSVLSRL